MTFYVKAGLSPGGLVELRGSMEKVEGRANATEFVQDDAAFLQKKAQRGWPDFSWQVESTPSGKYVVKAEELRMRQGKAKSAGSGPG